MRLNKNSHFIIITDTHFWGKNITGRKSYLKENLFVISKIEECISYVKSKKDGYKIYLIFLGDIFHRKISSPTVYSQWISTFLSLRAKVNGVFSVVGNHELSFSEDNPFWNLMVEVESLYAQQKGRTPVGLQQIIQIPDCIELFDTVIAFNHYGCPIPPQRANHNVLVSHELWSSKEIIDKTAIELNDKLYSMYSSSKPIHDGCELEQFEHCYFGHNHLLLGTYKISWDNQECRDTTLHYLGSLGLTNRTEVEKTKPVRILPILTVTKNGLTNEDYPIELLQSYEEVIDVDKTALLEEKKDTKKKLKLMLSDIELINSNPIETLRKDYQKDPIKLEIFENIEKGIIPEWIKRI